MRTPITLKIKFKSSSLEQFIERYSVDVSRGGIFIRTKEPLAVGTTLRFEFQLQDSSSLIGGEGTVVWNRAYDPARSGVAPGMGVRFDKLTADSQRVLDRILAEKHRRGEAQLESRFDAGFRATREARPAEFNDAGTPLPPAAPGLHGHFGDEPTRMMDAGQVSQLAEAMQREESFAQEQPTRRASMEEIQKAVAGQAVDRPDLLGGPSGRTGKTSEHVRLGSGISSPARTAVPMRSTGGPRVTSMGMVTPQVAAGAQPSNQTPVGGEGDEMPPSLATRQVPAAEAAALIALSTSAHTPPRSPETPVITAASGASAVSAPLSVTVSAQSASHAAHGDPSRPVLTPVGPTPFEAPVDFEPATVPAMPIMPALPRPSQASAPLFPDAASARSTPGDLAVIAAAPTLAGVAVPSTASAPPPEAPAARSQPAPVTSGKSPRPSEVAPAEANSGLSLTIPGVHGIDVELPQESPATPLDPQSFASPRQTDLVAAPTPAPPPALAEPAVLPVPIPTTGQSAPPSEPPWLVIILVVAIAVAGTVSYALYRVFRGGDGDKTPVTTPVKPPEPAKPAEPQKAPPSKAPEAPKPPEGQKPDEAKKPDEGQKPDEAQKAPDEAKAEDGLSVPLTSEPPGAKVTLAGKELGTTPTQLTGLQAGKTYELHLALRGYQDYKGKVKAQAGLKLPPVKLVAYERVVEILSTPKNAEVFVDGKKVGRTPYLLRKLDLSKVREVEVRKTGFAPQKRNISDTEAFAVKNGKEVLRLDVTLEGAVKPEGDAKPETKVDAKPEPKADARPETKPDAKTDAKPEAAKPVKAPRKPEARKPVEAKPDADKPAEAKPEPDKADKPAEAKPPKAEDAPAEAK